MSLSRLAIVIVALLGLAVACKPESTTGLVDASTVASPVASTGMSASKSKPKVGDGLDALTKKYDSMSNRLEELLTAFEEHIELYEEHYRTGVEFGNRIKAQLAAADGRTARYAELYENLLVAIVEAPEPFVERVDTNGKTTRTNPFEELRRRRDNQ